LAQLPPYAPLGSRTVQPQVTWPGRRARNIPNLPDFCNRAIARSPTNDTGEEMPRLKLQLHTKILLGFVLGILAGLLAGQFGLAAFFNSYVKPLGTAFIRLISMVVVPLVFASLLVGTGTLSDVRRLGRIGLKTFAYYLFFIVPSPLTFP